MSDRVSVMSAGAMVGSTVALLGAGVMGAALGRRLLTLGCSLRVYNRSVAKTADLQTAGASVHRSPAAAAAGVDWVLSVLTDTEALQAVMLAEDGAISADCSRRLIDLGTHDPATFTDFAAAADARGWSVVEAPMTGSVHDATHGSLNFLLGGEVGDVERARPFLEVLGRSVFHLGPFGSGNSAKLALNLLVGTMTVGLGEAIAMLEAQGLPVDSFLQALAGSGLASPLYERIGARYLAQDFTPRFSLANLEKDLCWARDHALVSGLQPVLAPAICRLLADFSPQLKYLDYSSLIACVVGSGPVKNSQPTALRKG